MRKDKNNITCNIRNITLNSKILTAHFTGKERIITLCFIILMLSFINITLSLSDTFCNSNVSALSYQGSAEIKFTFNPTLSINISSSNLTIDNLTPGTTSDSNIINVSVATNASHGYTLSATVGDSLHNNTNLTHINNTNIFSSITTNSSLSSLITDNTWGYSYKLSNNTTWNNYSGLSNESKTLVNTDNQIAKPIDFKIAAKASNTQPSGTYTNTINFIAISKPIPKTIEDIAYMQTFGELLPTDLQSVKDSIIQEHTYTLKDARDEQDYTIAKLKDGKIWMAKNLNLAGGTEITAELSDVPENYTLPTDNGFQEGNRLPESSRTGFSDSTQAYIYNTGNNTDNCANPGCYSYYSWHAATAGSGVDIATSNTDAPYSICPKGWVLPNSRSRDDPNWQNADFFQLAAAYGMNNFYVNAGPNTTPNFLISGYLSNGNFYNNEGGRYWSKTTGLYQDSIWAYTFTINEASVNAYAVRRPRTGFPIRCLAR